MISLWIGQTRLPFGGFTKIMGGFSGSNSSGGLASVPLLPADLNPFPLFAASPLLLMVWIIALDAERMGRSLLEMETTAIPLPIIDLNEEDESITEALCSFWCAAPAPFVCAWVCGSGATEGSL